jgi:hypothetical protein
MLSEITFHFLVYLSFIISVQLIFSSDTFLIQWLTIVITVFYLLFMALLYTDVVRKK